MVRGRHYMVTVQCSEFHSEGIQPSRRKWREKLWLF